MDIIITFLYNFINSLIYIKMPKDTKTNIIQNKICNSEKLCMASNSC